VKIIITTTVDPFVKGGAELMANWLCQKLKEYGHECEVLSLPFSTASCGLLSQLLAFRLLDIQNSADRVIAIRPPSYVIKHPNKVLWFIHHFRGYYDLWETRYGGTLNESGASEIRDSVVALDNVSLLEAKRIFTNSEIVSKRLKTYNDIDSEVLYPPLFNSEQYHCQSYGDYIFYPSRLHITKRQDLFVEALKYTKSDVRIVVAGKTDTPEYLAEIKSLVKVNGLCDRVEILDRWISEEEKIELFANALGTMYIPYDEDSYGYVSLESSCSRKPIITCSDSGGTLELIDDGVNGFVVSSKPKAIAEAMDKLFYDKKNTKKMGFNAFNKLNSMNISWNNVIEKLTL